ncbi:MAG TPA: SRPBCC family protein [Terriglobales bacterium]|nr:SRPBCC family protein [Terriglobales bacterium]
MSNTGNLKVEARGDHEVVFTRTFDAPAALVFDAHTKPELVKRWMLGPEGWTMPVCEIDLRVGGTYRYVWRHPKKGEMGLGGTFREIARPHRIVHTEKFDQPWYPGEAVVTTLFEEQGGKTTMTMVMWLESKEGRDGVLKSGMETGMETSYQRLDAIVAEQLAGKK